MQRACIGKISQGQYMLIVNKMIRFFEGKYEEVLSEYRDEMNSLASDLKFEEAAKLRDRILAIESIQKRQTVFYADKRNIDIVGFYQEESDAVCLLLRMQEGSIINTENYPLKNVAMKVEKRS
ncbi:MAG: UvrB/UvrC motif-containing protein [Candidatus Cloacimonetes bacterium]|nr:UvrB/UvrC motif-containing protein [Candidatus Cloacimonadota bacterium]